NEAALPKGGASDARKIPFRASPSRSKPRSARAASGSAVHAIEEPMRLSTALIYIVVSTGYLFASVHVLFGQPTPAANDTADAGRVHSHSTPVVKQGKSIEGKTIVGKASWYGPGLAGQKTASGEKFDPGKPTAASTRVPLGSHAVVTNLNNGRSVKVKINDRGPNVKGRKIDLSKKAARRLDMVDKGTAPVKIKVVDTPAGLAPH
ncbi:MAG: septal ring lytic transglycosylase RlpA family protein, partial [Candidatus Binataceae bacterium]